MMGGGWGKGAVGDGDGRLQKGLMIMLRREGGGRVFKLGGARRWW